MSNAIVSLFLVALMIVAGMTFSKTAINAFDDMTASWQEAESSRLETFRSDVAVVGTAVTPDGVEVRLKNSGQLPVGEYRDWDVIVQYYDSEGDYYIKHLVYTSGMNPEPNQWTLHDIYAGEDLSITEVFQPGILDPGEVGLLRLALEPAAGVGTPGWVILATVNGITSSAQFHNQET
ncbi:MAG: hypothetical protein PHU23_17045 [Dehalococcoidales bacterium]|nr:hypothetical protein [Dehalococcoidales bacterium]